MSINPNPAIMFVAGDYTVAGGVSVTMQRDPAQPSPLATVTATVHSAPLPSSLGFYTDHTKMNQDTCGCLMLRSDFNSLLALLAAGEVKLTITCDANDNVTAFRYEAAASVHARALLIHIAEQVDALEPAELRSDVEALRNDVKIINTHVARIDDALGKLLKLGDHPSSVPPPADGQYEPESVDPDKQ